MHFISEKELFSNIKSEQEEQKFLEAANQRLLAKREERRRLYPSAANIPIKTAAELATAALRHIDGRVIRIDLGHGLLPIKDALEGGEVWVTDDSGKRIPSNAVEIWVSEHGY